MEHKGMGSRVPRFGLYGLSVQSVKPDIDFAAKKSFDITVTTMPFRGLNSRRDRNMAQHCVRLPESLEGQVANLVRIDGHVSIAAFFRAAAQNELKRRAAGVPQAECEVAATLEQQSAR
jgi:hypothetical protein